MSASFSTTLRRLSNAGGGGGGGGSPGGTNGQVQYNNAGAFGGLASTGTGDVVRAVSAALTGTPTAPTAATTTNTTQIATTAFVQQEISGIVQVLAGEVANFAALPSAAANTGKNYLVRASQGVYFVNRKPAGIYTSDGVNWNYDGDATEAYFQDTLAWSNITSKPSTFNPTLSKIVALQQSCYLN